MSLDSELNLAINAGSKHFDCIVRHGMERRSRMSSVRSSILHSVEDFQREAVLVKNDGPFSQSDDFANSCADIPLDGKSAGLLIPET